jgi:hypothetical protein
MPQTHDVELGCSYGLWRHLGTEMLNVNLVHLGTAKGSAMDRTSGAYR